MMEISGTLRVVWGRMGNKAGFVFTKLAAIARSSLFYIGLPILSVIVGLSFAAITLVAGALDNTYFPVLPTQGFPTGIKIFLGLASAGLFSLTLMTIAKFVFRSSPRFSFVAFSFGCWIIGTGWVIYSSAPSEGAYRRIFDGQHFVIPWDRVPGDLTRRGNSIGQWDIVDKIGLSFCAEPLDVSKLGIRCEKRGTFLVGLGTIEGVGNLRNDHFDPEGRKLRQHFEQLQLRGPKADNSSSSSSSSTSGGGSSWDKPWEAIDAKKIPDIGGMSAFKKTTNYVWDDTIYLFDKAEPTDYSVHRAECRQGINDGQLIDPEFTCTHFLREGTKTWIFDLPLTDTARYAERLAQLKSQLELYRTEK